LVFVLNQYFAASDILASYKVSLVGTVE
jgi:hypothetical protein